MIPDVVRSSWEEHDPSVDGKIPVVAPFGRLDNPKVFELCAYRLLWPLIDALRVADQCDWNPITTRPSVVSPDAGGEARNLSVQP